MAADSRMVGRRSAAPLIVLLAGALSTCTTPVPTGLGSGRSALPPGSPAKLGFLVQPSVAGAGQALSPAVEVAVQDTQGTTVTTAADTITLAIGANPSNATLSGTTTMATVNGVATFSTLTLTTAGAGYTLNAYAVGLRGTTSAAFNIGAVTAAQLGFLVQPSVGAAGRALSPGIQVAIQDAHGSTVTTATNSVTIVIDSNPPGGHLSGATSVAAVNGVATFSTLSIDSPGSGYTLMASAAGLTGTTSATLAIFPSSFTSISANGSTGCALTNAGAAYCWGDNTYGELGIGSTRGPEDCVPDIFYACSTRPVAVSGGLTFRSISAGSCGVTTSGAAYCWGRNTYGQLGTGTTTNDSVPVAVGGGLTFATISAEGNYSCGVTTTSAGYCWGYNGDGELGNGTTTNSPEPVAVSGGLTFTAISTGEAHACGVVSSGAVYCWGDNSAGGLGNGTTTSSTTPVVVSGGLGYAAVSVGFGFSCGLTPDGEIYCWGDNTYGQLGNGTTTSSTSPVAVAGALTFATVSTNGTSVCGVTTSSAAYCWGNNSSGQLGNGTGAYGPNVAPAAVSGGLKFAVVSGSCGLILSGAAYCWGNDVLGQLGDGTMNDDINPPVLVFDRARVSAGGRLRAAAP
jgi:alpha-tubulin suppressor-like RCC1 family protein